MDLRTEIVVTNSEQTAARLRLLDNNVQRNVMSRVLRYAAKPVVQQLRAASPVRTGALKKSIGFVVRKYPGTQSAVAVIGARKEFGKFGKTYAARKIVPYKYIYLVENPSAAQPAYEARRGKNKVWTKIKRGRPALAGKRFVAGVRSATSASTLATIAQQLAVEVDKEIGKL